MTDGGPRKPGEMSRILNDDALLDNLGRKGGKGLQDELSNLLGSWRDDIDSEPLGRFLTGDEWILDTPQNGG
jgi:hypothetical protein